jgi:hypothetical protein
MVDALRRAHRIVQPRGRVIDLHPAAAPAAVEVGSERTGHVDAGDAPLRHAAAGVALARIVDAGAFAIERTFEFAFHTYGDSIDELREYIEENWREGTIDAETVSRTRQALRANPHVNQPRVREQVCITKLRPVAAARE